MATLEMEKRVIEELKSKGIRARMVSAGHVNELREAIESKRQAGLTDLVYKQEKMMDFEYDAPERFDGAKTLIVAAAPQPSVQVVFRWEGRDCDVVIPPTYSYGTDHQIQGVLEDVMKPKGYRLVKVRLPFKTLAIRSGLAQYGRNNITYVPGLGSFARLTVFLTDLPSSTDPWGPPRSMKACRDCTACMDACPTGAISPDRFLLRAERCLTFFNEGSGTFPTWLEQDWHSCLVGCMHCQTACPVNKKKQSWVEKGESFTETETEIILQGAGLESIPEETRMKLERLDIIEYCDKLGRNLGVLLGKTGRQNRRSC